MNRNPRHEKLIRVLRVVRGILARPDNDFMSSRWKDSHHAVTNVDELIEQCESGSLPARLDITLLFAPTGPIQEVSVSSGWGEEFLELAEQCDAAIKEAYET